jgi:shikimate kinase
MRIYLVGYMGSGKSTLGRRLAGHAGLHFIDLDKYIEERNCRTVPQIFALEGEESFRKKERKALEEVSEFDNVVVATGGGAPCFWIFTLKFSQND